MGVLTGFGGHISQGDVEGGGNETKISCVRTWGISLSAGLGEIICSATKGGRLRTDGNYDWSGQFTGYGYDPPVLPGEKFEFEGAITGSAGSAVGAKGDVIVDSVAIAWDQEGGAPIQYTVNFGGAGALTLGTVTCPADDGTPNPAASKACAVHIAAPAAAPSYAAIDEVRAATLTLLRNNQTLHTAGGSGWPNRAKGNFDCTLELTVYADDSTGWSALPQPNDEKFVKLFVDGATETDHWLIKAFKFSDLGGMDVDIEGSAMVGATLSAGLHGWQYFDSAWNEGVVTKPDSTDVWPE